MGPEVLRKNAASHQPPLNPDICRRARPSWLGNVVLARHDDARTASKVATKRTPLPASIATAGKRSMEITMAVAIAIESHHHLHGHIPTHHPREIQHQASGEGTCLRGRWTKDSHQSATGSQCAVWRWSSWRTWTGTRGEHAGTEVRWMEVKYLGLAGSGSPLTSVGLGDVIRMNFGVGCSRLWRGKQGTVSIHGSLDPGEFTSASGHRW